MTHKPKLIGVNHIVLEVDDLAAALDFWRAVFDFQMRGQGAGHAFLDMGDQFIGLVEGQGPNSRSGGRDQGRHFGLVVDDRARVKDLARAAGAEVLDNDFCDIVDPWGNRIQIVEYRDIQFAKTDGALSALGVSAEKTGDAKAQIAKKGMA